MNLRVSTPVAVAIIAIVAAVAGLLIYRGVTKQEVGTTAGMPPELRAKILGQYRMGNPGPAGAPRAPGAPSTGAGR